MRYEPGHKAEVHQRIVKDASRRVRTEGLSGAAVVEVMRGTGLTHGGFYKHFKSKEELLSESLSEAFRETADRLIQAARRAEPGSQWKAIVNTYLSLEHCDHPAFGCPLAALSTELTRADRFMKARILAEMANYKRRMLPFMPGHRAAERERAFFAIFSTMIGAVELARILPEPAMKKKVLASANNLILRGFDSLDRRNRPPGQRKSRRVVAGRVSARLG